MYSTQSCLNGTFKHTDTAQANAHMHTHTNMHTHTHTFPLVIPPICLMQSEVMILGKDRLEREGWGCLGRVRERGKETPEKACPAAVWLKCVVVFSARKPRRSHELIIWLLQLRHSQWTESAKQRDTGHSSGSESSQSSNLTTSWNNLS